MRYMPLTVLVTVIVHLFNMCHSVDFWNFSSLELFLSLRALSSKVNRGKPLVDVWRHHFSKIICQTLNFVEANHSRVPLPTLQDKKVDCLARYGIQQRKQYPPPHSNVSRWAPHRNICLLRLYQTCFDGLRGVEVESPQRMIFQDRKLKALLVF